jgi:hypothetical protein
MVESGKTRLALPQENSTTANPVPRSKDTGNGLVGFALGRGGSGMAHGESGCTFQPPHKA